MKEKFTFQQKTKLLTKLFDAGCNTEKKLQQLDMESILKMFGYTVLDDSGSMLLGEDGWIKERTNRETDLYFFGYGYNYRGALKAYYRLTGEPPMLPAYTLGNWWSRYYKYAAKEDVTNSVKFR